LVFNDGARKTFDFKFIYVLVDKLHSLLYEAICKIVGIDHGSEIWHTDEVSKSSNVP